MSAPHTPQFDPQFWASSFRRTLTAIIVGAMWADAEWALYVAVTGLVLSNELTAWHLGRLQRAEARRAQTIARIIGT